MTVRAACFDLLSALLDSWVVWDAVAAELGTPELGRAWRRRYLVLTATTGAYRPYVALVAEAASSVRLPPGAASALQRRWGELEPWPDVVPALSAIEVPVAVVTNCSEALGHSAAARVGIRFDAVVTAEVAGAYKPDPAPYRLACERLGHAASEVAYGRRLALRRAGCPGAWVPGHVGEPARGCRSTLADGGARHRIARRLDALTPDAGGACLRGR